MVRLNSSLGLSMYGTIWTENQEKYRLSLIKPSLKLAINYSLDNCYFTLSSMSFLQLVGIPKGSDLVSFMANIVLYYYKRT